MKSSFSLILFTCALIMPTIRSHIIVRRRYTDQLIEEFYDLPALFGGPIPSSGIRVYPLEAHPDDGCKEQPTPAHQLPNEPVNNRKFVLVIARNNCTFEEKVRNAQNAKYDAAIIYNIGSDDLEQMSAKNASGIAIPAVFVGETSGRYIIEYYINDNEYVLIINDALPFNINKNLIIPFSILVGLCFIIMIFYMIYKCVREQRRLNQYRLPKRLLKKIQVIKFSEGQPYDCCVICLEEYTKGERIRVLPCKHAYHCHCIDVWLTKNRRVCPICKRRVFVKSETRNQTRRRPASSDSTTDTDDDVQPLINVYSNSNDHGTFPQNEQNDNGNQTNINSPRDVGQATTDDDDNVLNLNEAETQNNSNLRENPFNRNLSGNEQANSETNGNERRGFWNYLKSRFSRRSDSLTTPLFNEIENPFRDHPNEERINPNENDDINPISINVPIPHTASNNILNTNLSGSFQDNAPISSISPAAVTASSSLTTVQITNSSKKKNKSKRSPVNSNNSDQQTTPISQEQSSTITTIAPTQNITTDNDAFVQTPLQGGIGVAALPNADLNRDQNDRSASRNRRDFII